MAPVLSVLLLGASAAGLWAVWRALALLRQARTDGLRTRTLHILALFAPGRAAAAVDPRAILTWQPLAVAARGLYPDEFAALDRATGGPFPFAPSQIDEAHARWTAEWLAWELAHDTAYKLKVAEAQAALHSAPAGRARLDAVEREKLEAYQTRYGEYIRVAKALQSLLTPSGS